MLKHCLSYAQALLKPTQLNSVHFIYLVPSTPLFSLRRTVRARGKRTRPGTGRRACDAALGKDKRRGRAGGLPSRLQPVQEGDRDEPCPAYLPAGYLPVPEPPPHRLRAHSQPLRRLLGAHPPDLSLRFHLFQPLSSVRRGGGFIVRVPRTLPNNIRLYGSLRKPDGRIPSACRKRWRKVAPCAESRTFAHPVASVAIFDSKAPSRRFPPFRDEFYRPGREIPLNRR